MLTLVRKNHISSEFWQFLKGGKLRRELIKNLKFGLRKVFQCRDLIRMGKDQTKLFRIGRNNKEWVLRLGIQRILGHKMPVDVLL